LILQDNNGVVKRLSLCSEINVEGISGLVLKSFAFSGIAAFVPLLIVMEQVVRFQARLLSCQHLRLKISTAETHSATRAFVASFSITMIAAPPLVRPAHQRKTMYHQKIVGIRRHWSVPFNFFFQTLNRPYSPVTVFRFHIPCILHSSCICFQHSETTSFVFLEKNSLWYCQLFCKRPLYGENVGIAMCSFYQLWFSMEHHMFRFVGRFIYKLGMTWEAHIPNKSPLSLGFKL